jgi:hypothetical protein
MGILDQSVNCRQRDSERDLARGSSPIVMIGHASERTFRIGETLSRRESSLDGFRERSPFANS